MKRYIGILILAVVAGTASAQTPATVINNAKGAAAQMNKNTAQTNAALPATAAKTPAKPAATSVPASVPQNASAKPAPAPAKPSTVSVKTTPVTAAPKPAKTAKPVAKKEAKAEPPAAAAANADPTAASESANSKKRDPFISPIVSKVGGPTNCAGGKKCLVVDQVALRGIVRSQNGMIAVIVNAANKAYFMRENDPVYNGFVVKITPDSIVFRETVTDRFGKAGTREVVKKVNAPVV
jgi:Tfp pilus assembly protein PilP